VPRSDTIRTLVISKEANMVYIKHQGLLDQAIRLQVLDEILAHDDFVGGMCFIIDLREADLNRLSAKDNQELATTVDQLSDMFIGSREAIVVSERTADYGIMRQFELMAADHREGKDRHVRVCTRFAEACQWLRLQGHCEMMKLEQIPCELAGREDPDCAAPRPGLDTPDENAKVV
jgi:hypothetical protein